MDKRSLLIITLACIYIPLVAQQSAALNVSGAGDTLLIIAYPRKLDSILVINKFSESLRIYQSKGFLAATIDSFIIYPTRSQAFVSFGHEYRWGTITIDSCAREWFDISRRRLKQMEGNAVTLSEISKLSSSSTRKLENNGYPFASVIFKQVQFVSNEVHLSVDINKGPLIVYDTLYVKGDARVSQQFIETYLGYKPGTKYNESEVSQFGSRLANLPFISQIRPVEVEFTKGSARVYTYLSNQKANYFSGILGFSSNPTQGKGILLTGDLNLRLTNAVRRGETISFHWYAMGEGNQRLNFSSIIPYLFRSNFSLNGAFSMYRRDSTYLTINPSIQALFSIGMVSQIGFGYSYRSSYTALASNSDVYNFTSSIYNLSFTFGGEPTLIFPVNAKRISVNVGIGSRETSQPGGLNSSPSAVSQMHAEYTRYLPLTLQGLVLKLNLKGEMIRFIRAAASDYFMENEHYRLGGIGSLRGFTKESIKTTEYGVGGIELQFRIQNTINTYLFIEKAAVKDAVKRESNYKYPLGVGFGIQIKNAGGVLNISNAFGNGMGETIALRNSKIHVGYSAFF